MKVVHGTRLLTSTAAIAPCRARVHAMAAGPATVLAAAAMLSCAAPALADTPAGKRARVAVDDAASLRLRPGSVASALDTGRFQFTAPGRAPGRAMTVERGFRFTPSGSPSAKALALGVSARAIAAAPATGGQAARAAAPVDTPASAYSVDVAVAWKGFALSGGVDRADDAFGLAPREGVDVGLSYGGRDWTTGVLAKAERGGSLLTRQSSEPRYMFEATGAFALSPSLSVNGGLRYRLDAGRTGLLNDAEDRAVFVGGALAF